ncbi:1-phosphofructokinase family hexose kinase [Microbacterium sp. NPDC055910]|uniref:1-phosphofructokinase family hexose kinase n=1 Tax=Microbacterium sp. NPDC055910 TaxID=3345659 RepID=UPI0035DCC9C9
MRDVTIFAPVPILTVTVEGQSDGPEVHIHAGGQGVWQARMLRRLGVDVTMCCVLSGETGTVLRHLLEDEGISVAAVERSGRGAAYLHDRRDGERTVVAQEDGDPLGRHELDELYGVVLREALGERSRLVILSGPAGEEALPPETYRRLAADLRAGGATVVVDLAGDRLEAALEGGVDVLKVSHEELRDDGLIDEASPHEIMAAMRRLRDTGAATVIVTRAEEPALFLDAGGFLEIRPPQFEIADTHGAGDSLTAGTVAGIARGEAPRDAVILGAAAGALNVTRHGLGTGDPDAIIELRQDVVVTPLADDAAAGIDQPVTGRVSPDGLAALAEPADGDAEED